METTAVKFGSRFAVRVIRVFQIVFAAGACLSFNIVHAIGDGAILQCVGMIIFIAFEIYESYVVCAVLNPDGLSYCRWGTWTQLNWRDMYPQVNQPLAFLTVVKIIGRPIWARYLLLLPVKPHPPEASKKPEVIRFRKMIEPSSGRTN